MKSGIETTYDEFNGRGYTTITCCVCKAEFDADVFNKDGVWIDEKPYCGDCKPEDDEDEE